MQKIEMLLERYFSVIYPVRQRCLSLLLSERLEGTSACNCLIVFAQIMSTFYMASSASGQDKPNSAL